MHSCLASLIAPCYPCSLLMLPSVLLRLSCQGAAHFQLWTFPALEGNNWWCIIEREGTGRRLEVITFQEIPLLLHRSTVRTAAPATRWRSWSIWPICYFLPAGLVRRRWRRGCQAVPTDKYGPLLLLLHVISQTAFPDRSKVALVAFVRFFPMCVLMCFFIYGGENSSPQISHFSFIFECILWLCMLRLNFELDW